MGGYISSIMFPAPKGTYTKEWDHYVDIPLKRTIGIFSCSGLDDSVESISGFFFRRDDTKTTILYSHGNATDIGQIYNWMFELSKRLRVNVLCYDYLGYGLNGGQASEQECYRCIESAYEYLLKKGIPASSIVAYGRSIGTGPTVHLATKVENLKGVVLESAYTSVFGVVSKSLATVSYCVDQFKNESKISKINAPILLFHGTKDQVIPHEHAEALQKKSQCNLVSFNGGGHNDLTLMYGAEMIQHLNQFIHGQ